MQQFSKQFSKQRTNCIQNDVTSARHCWTGFCKKNNCILLLSMCIQGNIVIFYSVPICLSKKKLLQYFKLKSHLTNSRRLLFFRCVAYTQLRFFFHLYFVECKLKSSNTFLQVGHELHRPLLLLKDK